MGISAEPGSEEDVIDVGNDTSNRGTVPAGCACRNQVVGLQETSTG
jgi:hypothetical protein